MVLIVPFILQIMAAVGLVGYLSFRNGQQAVNSVAFQLCREISDRIDQKLRTFLSIPFLIHQNNEAAIRLGHINVRDLTGLRRYFWQQVQIFGPISDIGLGNAQAELIAVSSVENDTGTVRLVNAATGYDMKVYAVDALGEPRTFIHETPNYKTRQRPWYQDAAKAGKPTWSKIFPRLGNIDRLTISAVHPIYNQKKDLTGVLYILLPLSQIGHFLQNLTIGKTGQSFILEPDGFLIATSVKEPLLHQEESAGKRRKVTESSNPTTRATSQYLLAQFGDFKHIRDYQQLSFEIDRKRHFLQVLPFHDDKGLNWIVVVVVPEIDFMEQIYANNRNTVLLSLLAFVVAAIAGILTARWITDSISQIAQASEVLAQGNLDQHVTPNAITEIGKLANSFNSMANQLKASFAELEEKNADLQRLDQLKDEFLANTSHELRTPLNGMIGIAESMLDGATGNLSGEQQHNLALLTQSSKRLVNLVNDILDFSKLRHRELHLYLKPVSLREMVEIVLQLDRMLISTRDLQLLNQVPADLPLVNADENRLQQILHNLIGNAIKFTPAGKVKISAKLIGNREDGGVNLSSSPLSSIAVSISDTGIGIPSDKLDRIFESFEQVEGSARRQYGGTGLGLAITRNLVELHNGQIWVESTLGEGSVFTFTLPITEPVSPPGTEQFPPILSNSLSSSKADQGLPLEPRLSTTELSSPELSAEPMQKGYSHILIVDDEPVNLQVLKNFLKFQNYTLTLASDGLAALSLLEQGLNPDIVLLDVMMPRMTGYEVIQSIRQQTPADRLPIILLSARNQPEDIVLGLEVGANDYLTKPISKDELLARIHTHLQLRQLEEETIRLTSIYERQLAQFLDALPVGVTVHRPDGSVFYFNRMAKQILQRDALQDMDAEQLASAYQVYQAGTHTLYPDQQLPAIRALQGECVRTEDVEIHLSQTVIPLEVLATPILNEQGVVEYAIAAFQDITERKRTEQILADYSRELEQAVNQRTAELAQTNVQLYREIEERQQVEQNLQLANQELQRLATIDELTQVANRRYFDQQLQQEWQRLKREQHPLSLILFDVDYFKRYNDCYGHQAGDMCLMQVAQTAQAMVNRPADLVARYGGEEFAVVLPKTDQHGAITIAECIRQAVRALAIPHTQSAVAEIVTISLGVATVIPTSANFHTTLIALADQALYAAKQQGRDRYSVG
jgi:two-component system sensor histidine kinase ChiS